MRFFTSPSGPLTEHSRQAFPDWHFVKALNWVGSALMFKPPFPGGKPTRFYCGNGATAKSVVARIADLIGWEGANVGMANAVRAIEPLASVSPSRF